MALSGTQRASIQDALVLVNLSSQGISISDSGWSGRDDVTLYMSVLHLVSLLQTLIKSKESPSLIWLRTQRPSIQLRCQRGADWYSWYQSIQLSKTRKP